MEKKLLNYETIVEITKIISESKDPDEVMSLTVKSITQTLGVKGCALFLHDRRSKQLEVASAFGLSEEYLNKGPISSLHSIAESLQEGPVAIYDVLDDPRIQYPHEAKKEGIASILSVPMIVRSNVLGALRVYTSTSWEFTLDDVNFVQAVAEIAALIIENARHLKGFKDSVEILKEMRDPGKFKHRRDPSHPEAPVTGTPH